MTSKETDNNKPSKRPDSLRKPTCVVSAVLENGDLVETIYRPDLGTTSFIKGAGDDWTYKRVIRTEDGSVLTPPGPGNNLLRHGAVLLPTKPADYETEEALLAYIEGYIHHYVDLSPVFEKIAARYVLLTWVHDAFNELPYLRFRGEYGSGKTRALTVIGSLCYKAFFASGASTTSPIFHVLDGFGSTLVLDEADFRMSDEKSDLVKILNNGNVKGLPVLRTMLSPDGKEFNPRAFSVFGPKLVAARGQFEDRALESRFITEEMGRKGLRGDIPINLPDEQRDEATALRNMLLLYRLRNRNLMFVDESLVDPVLEPRFNQILVPLLSVTADLDLQRKIQMFVRGVQSDFVSERSESLDGRVLEIIAQVLAKESRKSCPVSELAASFTEQFGGDFERPMTPKRIGYILRKRLGLSTFRNAGVFYVSLAEREKLSTLFRRHGLAEDAATVSAD